jgi:hypothetical protein
MRALSCNKIVSMRQSRDGNIWYTTIFITPLFFWIGVSLEMTHRWIHP